MRVNCTYHPAALERAADSIRGVETQGLGRSGDGRLPMFEDCWFFLGGAVVSMRSRSCLRGVLESKVLKEGESFAWYGVE